MNLTDILNDPPKPHEDLEGRSMVWGLTEAALEFIYENINDQCTTLETGCGLSTVVFALKGSRHTVIAPAPSEFEITKSYCRDRGIPTSQITFITEPSQTVLPVLESDPLDLVLIDGGHGFPTPYIDWFYTAGKLKKGGYLVVDDVGLWSCQILRDFLIEQPHWEFVAEYEERTTVFRKVEDGSEWLEWTDQPRVARGGRVKWIEGQLRWDRPRGRRDSSAIQRVFTDLKNGNFETIRRKIARRIFRQY
jgi:hypothetical protein